MFLQEFLFQKLR